jgi:hypothetical protein
VRENAALLHLLGYELEPTVRLVKPARALRRVQFLTLRNSIHARVAAPAIKHYPACDRGSVEHLRRSRDLRERVG